MKVELHSHPKGIVGSAWLDDQGKVQMDDGANKLLLRQEFADKDLFVYSRDLDREVTVEDGEHYLRALSGAWRGSYMWAEVSDRDLAPD